LFGEIYLLHATVDFIEDVFLAYGLCYNSIVYLCCELRIEFWYFFRKSQGGADLL